MSQVDYLEPSLAEIIERVGERLLKVVLAPRGLRVPVSGPSIFDPLNPAAPPPGSMVLLVGVAPAVAAPVIRTLGGAAAAVVRASPEEAEPLAEAATEAGLALIALPGAMTWSHLHVLLEESLPLSDGMAADPGRDLGSVPAGDLNALVNAIAETLDRPVGIVDMQWRLMAYSAVPGQVNDALQRDVILNRAVPPTNAPRETRHLLLTGERALRFPTGPPYDELGAQIWRIGVGIRSGPEPLGMLWVLEGCEQLPAERFTLIEEFARLAAVHLLRVRTARDAERQRRGELAGQALDGHEPRAALRHLGLDPSGRLAVLAVAEAGPASAAEQLLDRVATYLAAYRRSAACVLREETVYCLTPATGLAALRELRGLAVDLVRQLGARRPLLAGVGRPAGAEDLPRSLHEADLTLAALRASPSPGSPGAVVGAPGAAVATIEEVWAAGSLIELRALLDAHPRLLLHEVGPVDEDSVLAWIECHGDVRAAAERLGVHPNTLRYRIRRLAAQGLDLNDPDTRLVTWLRLRTS